MDCFPSIPSPVVKEDIYLPHHHFQSIMQSFFVKTPALLRFSSSDYVTCHLILSNELDTYGSQSVSPSQFLSSSQVTVFSVSTSKTLTLPFPDTLISNSALSTIISSLCHQLITVPLPKLLVQTSQFLIKVCSNNSLKSILYHQ